MFDPSCFCSCNSPKRIWWVTLHDVYTILESSMYIPNVTWYLLGRSRGPETSEIFFSANEPGWCATMCKYSWVLYRPPLLGWWPSPTEKNGCLDPSTNGNMGFALSAPAIAAAHPTPWPWLRSQLEKLRKWHTFYYSIPKDSVYGIFTHIWLVCIINVGKYIIHWSYGIRLNKNWKVWMTFPKKKTLF